jgi:RsiW-degrading membrane proteinase PrsW (M82 family)
MVAWGSATQLAFEKVAFLYAIYFASMWGVLLYLFLRPERIGWIDIVRVAFFTAVSGIAITGLAQQLPILSHLYALRTSSDIPTRLAGYVLGVGLTEESVKALPLVWIFLRNREPGSLREITFLGCVSGFAFGASEAAYYSLSYVMNLGQGLIDFGSYFLVQYLRLTTLPLLHALFSGIAAYFIAVAACYGGRRRGYTMLGVAFAALLHGLYNTFVASGLGLVVATLTVLLFTSYGRRLRPDETVSARRMVSETLER